MSEKSGLIILYHAGSMTRDLKLPFLTQSVYFHQCSFIHLNFTRSFSVQISKGVKSFCFDFISRWFSCLGSSMDMSSTKAFFHLQRRFCLATSLGPDCLTCSYICIFVCEDSSEVFELCFHPCARFSLFVSLFRTHHMSSHYIRLTCLNADLT